MNCRGQALAEFAVAAAVLAMLLLGLPVISRYHDLQVATLQGARRLAFERSWRGESVAAPDAQTLRSDLLPAAASADQPEPAAIRASYGRAAIAPQAAGAERALLAPFRLTARAGAGFDLRAADLQRASLRVAVSRPEGLPQPFDEIPVELSADYALLGDAWMSADPQQAARRAGALTAGPALQPAAGLLALGRGLLSIIEPAFREFCPGTIDPERVPADRLTTDTTSSDAAVTDWRAPC